MDTLLARPLFPIRGLDSSFLLMFRPFCLLLAHSFLSSIVLFSSGTYSRCVPLSHFPLVSPHPPKNNLQALNERRSEATEVTPEAYDALVATLHVFLDGCGPAPPQPPTPTPTPKLPGAIPATVPAKPLSPRTPATAGTRSRVSPSSSTLPSVETGRSPPVSPAGAFVGRPSARRRRRTGSAVSQ